jgi:hypothetical protein
MAPDEDYLNRSTRFLAGAVGRLREGVTREEAEAELARVSHFQGQDPIGKRFGSAAPPSDRLSPSSASSPTHLRADGADERCGIPAVCAGSATADDTGESHGWSAR